MYSTFLLSKGKRLTLLATLTLSVFTTSCGDKDDDPVIEEEPIVEITDGNAVTASLTIPGASVHEGRPPAPSTDANAPELYDESEWGGSNDQVTFAGKSFYLDTYNENGETVAGVYFQVKGADSYFDIPVSSGNERRKQNNEGSQRLSLNQFSKKGKQTNAKSQSDNYVEIPLPDNLGPGQFCASYCIYDAENRVSNVVELCITVAEFGGEGSEFLTANNWAATKEIYSENGETEETIVGENDFNTYEHDFGCAEPLSVTEGYRVDYYYMYFGVDGALKID